MDKNLTPWWLVVATILAIGMAISVSGCASINDSLQTHEERHCDGWTHQYSPSDGKPFFYQWTKTRASSEKPWLYIRVDNPNITCRLFGVQASGTLIVDACAIWQPQNCIIILPTN